MNYNENDFINDFFELRDLVDVNSQTDNGETTSLSKFFGEEVYLNTKLWKTIIEPYLKAPFVFSFTKYSKRISRNLEFTNKMHSDIAHFFSNKFTDLQLRCIVEAMMVYKNTNLNSECNIRNYIQIYIKEEGELMGDSDDVSTFKSKISRISLIEFKILLDLVVQLMEENNSAHIFKLVKAV